MRVIEFAKNGSEFGGQNLFHVWRIGSTSQLRGINLKAPQPQTRKNEMKLSWALFPPAVAPATHGLETHGGPGWGKAKRDKCDKSGALQGGTVRVRAPRSRAHPTPRSEFFYLVGRAANRPTRPEMHRRALHSSCFATRPRSKSNIQHGPQKTDDALTKHNLVAYFRNRPHFLREEPPTPSQRY